MYLCAKSRIDIIRCKHMCMRVCACVYVSLEPHYNHPTTGGADTFISRFCQFSNNQTDPQKSRGWLVREDRTHRRPTTPRCGAGDGRVGCSERVPFRAVCVILWCLAKDAKLKSNCNDLRPVGFLGVNRRYTSSLDCFSIFIPSVVP